MVDVVAGIDSQNNIRMEVEIQGLYKSTPYGGIVDTGFSGGLVIPLTTAVDIGLTKVGASSITLADGTIKVIPTFLSQVKIGGLVQDATTLIMGNEVLIGMELLAPYRMCISPMTGEVTMSEWDSANRISRLAQSLSQLGG